MINCGQKQRIYDEDRGLACKVPMKAANGMIK